MCPISKWVCGVVPVAALAAGVVALAGGAFAGSEAPARANLPQAPNAVAPAPEGLSPATTTRDWQEAAGTPTRRIWF